MKKEQRTGIKKVSDDNSNTLRIRRLRREGRKKDSNSNRDETLVSGVDRHKG